MGYKKGSKAERELLEMLYECGFSVVRSAGSGNLKKCPDVVAIKSGRIIGMEVKFWSSERLVLSKMDLQELLEWARRASAELYIAWKVPRRGWFFLKPEDLKEKRKSFVISLKEAERRGIKFDVLVGSQLTLDRSVQL